MDVLYRILYYLYPILVLIGGVAVVVIFTNFYKWFSNSYFKDEATIYVNRIEENGELDFYFELTPDAYKKIKSKSINELTVRVKFLNDTHK